MPEPEPGSPLWWVGRLFNELESRQPAMQLHRDLVDDEHSQAVTAETSRRFAQLAGLSTTNLTGLVVEATAERMEVEGFRFGSDPDADSDAWYIWQRSDFDAGAGEAITHALVYGRCPISVDPNGGEPLLLCEDPRQVVVAYSSDGRRERRAALKVFADEWTGVRFATLYLPDAVYRFQDDAPTSSVSAPRPVWLPRRVTGQPVVTGNPLGEVPFFELRNRPLGRTRSEVANLVIPQRRLNQAIFNMDAVAEYGAFRQKWATGIEVPRDPQTGAPVAPYEAHVAKLFVADGVDAKFGDFSPTDLSGYLRLAQEIASHIARISRVPVTYFLTDVSNLSADALALLVSGLVRKCQRRVLGYEPALEGAMRLAFRSIGDPRGDAVAAEVRWASMETRSVAQDADAAVKLTQGENPVITPETAQERYLGMSQTERDRDAAWRSEGRASADLDAVLRAAQVAPL